MMTSEAAAHPTLCKPGNNNRDPMPISRIRRLTLPHFRNYRAASLQTRGNVVVLFGPNGAGKTNAIEAISFLSPGRELRRATLDDVADNQGAGSCTVCADVEGALRLATADGQRAVKLEAMLRARGDASAFPSAQIMLDGWMESALLGEPATSVEDRYREILRVSRARDAAAGRTLDGPHLTDLQVIFAPKHMPARDASTGEQKALLIGLVLAHASLVAEMTGITPLLLLDEGVPHLDPERRPALFDERAKLGAQVWMTGADPLAFSSIVGSGEIFDVDAGQITRRA